MGKLSSFLKQNLWWWLTPIIVIVLIMILLVIFGNSNSEAPFVYALF
jgi:ABC-type dipeptide/oligopeptide/nickel transport system permease subunit